MENELQGTVVSGSIALTAKSSSILGNRIEKSGSAYFDILAGVDIEIDLGYKLGDKLFFGF